MAIVQVKDATGPVLDWMVAKCEGVSEETFSLYYTPIESSDLDKHGYPEFHYSSVFAQGSPIIDREFIVTAEHREVGKTGDGVEFDRIVGWKAHVAGRCYWSTVKVFYGRTHLIAAMRAYVASKLGDTVEVPDELI